MVFKLLSFCTVEDKDVEMAPRAVIKITGEAYKLDRYFIAAKELIVQDFLQDYRKMCVFERDSPPEM